jgi:hypothetical protein
MKAVLLFNLQYRYADGAILQMRIWRLPEASDERRHGLKYSLFYGFPGERIIGYDNERGKGDHVHYGEVEKSYVFRSLKGLIEDFERDVARERGEP